MVQLIAGNCRDGVGLGIVIPEKSNGFCPVSCDLHNEIPDIFLAEKFRYDKTAFFNKLKSLCLYPKVAIFVVDME
jgi:hypothetical protein